jgi:nucleoside recognition membrane protein YjiH
MALTIAIIAGIAATLRNDFRTLFFMGKEVVAPLISNTATPAIAAIAAISAICGGVVGGMALCCRVLLECGPVRERSIAFFLQMCSPIGVGVVYVQEDR